MIIKKKLFVLGLLVLFAAGCSNSYDVVLKGGTIYDGMGGAPADILVFDPDKISDKATYDAPHQYSVGVQFLLIEGKLVIENGSYNGQLFGKPIRMNKK